VKGGVEQTQKNRARKDGDKEDEKWGE